MDVSSLGWPTTRPAHGGVELREFRTEDVAMVRDLATDPYVPLIGTLPAHANDTEALDYIDRQRGRLREGAAQLHGDRRKPARHGRVRPAPRRTALRTEIDTAIRR